MVEKKCCFIRNFRILRQQIKNQKPGWSGNKYSSDEISTQQFYKTHAPQSRAAAGNIGIA
jgi:hypothetical protein